MYGTDHKHEHERSVYCDACGDCLECYSEDECHETADGIHLDLSEEE